MDKLLLSSAIIASLTELLPQYGFSYFPPIEAFTNPKVYQHYLTGMLSQQALVVGIVWIPIFLKLYTLDPISAVTATSLIMIAFATRVGYNQLIAGLLYICGFLLIANIIYKSSQNDILTSDKLINTLIPILTIIFGGLLISVGRYKQLFNNKNTSKIIDISGRIVFTLGFFMFIDSLINIKDTASASEAMRSYQYYYIPLEKTSRTSIIMLENVFVNRLGVERTFIPNKAIYVLGSGKIKEKQLISYINNYDHKVFFSILHNHLLGSKYWLWYCLARTFGKQKASQVMPLTFLLPDEYVQYKQYVSHNKNNKFILKTDAQKQKTLWITESVPPLQMINKEKFLVAQSYMNNPMLFRDHKINLRLYLVVIMSSHLQQVGLQFNVTSAPNKKYMIKGYVSDDGIMSYASGPYKKNTNNPSYNIASFYDSEKLYEESNFPISTKQYLEYHVNKKIKTKILRSVYSSLHKVMVAYEHIIAVESFQGDPNKRTDIDITKLNKITANLKHNICCEIFGVDFFVNNKGNTSILEINMGPGMSPIGETDKHLRHKLFTGMVNIVNCERNTFGVTAYPDNFKQIY